MAATHRFALLLAALLAGCETPEPRVYPTVGSIERLDPRLDAWIPKDAKIELLAEGFEWSEGPVWVDEDGGYVLFSDIPNNVVNKWSEAGGLETYLKPAGYTGESTRGGEPGSNGLTLDADGNLILCQHGDRRIARMAAPLDAPQPQFETVADRFDGKRFNSPNDLAFDSDGNLYFTDPPYGLKGGPNSKDRELDFCGVYRLNTSGELELLCQTMTRPNGIALSPDERTLYVAQSDGKAALWNAFAIDENGAVGEPRKLFDATSWVGERQGSPDGMKVAPDGTIFATAPGGVIILTPDGEHLGTIQTGQRTANCCFGDDGRWLYMTADMYLLRVRLADG